MGIDMGKLKTVSVLDGKSVRYVVDENGEPWFVESDALLAVRSGQRYASQICSFKLGDGRQRIHIASENGSRRGINVFFLSQDGLKRLGAASRDLCWAALGKALSEALSASGEVSSREREVVVHVPESLEGLSVAELLTALLEAAAKMVERNGVCRRGVCECRRVQETAEAQEEKVEEAAPEPAQVDPETIRRAVAELVAEDSEEETRDEKAAKPVKKKHCVETDELFTEAMLSQTNPPKDDEDYLRIKDIPWRNEVFADPDDPDLKRELGKYLVTVSYDRGLPPKKVDASEKFPDGCNAYHKTIVKFVGEWIKSTPILFAKYRPAAEARA